MRLRIQTASPLPPLKAWFIPDFPYPGTSNSTLNATATTTTRTSSYATTNKLPTTIYDLKKALCAHVPTLSEDKRCRAESVILFLEDFELLDGTPFAGGVVRDGDLVVIGLKDPEKVKDLEVVRDFQVDVREDLQPKALNEHGGAVGTTVNGSPNVNSHKRSRSVQASTLPPNPLSPTSCPAPASPTKRPRTEPEPPSALSPSVPSQIPPPQCTDMNPSNDLGTTSTDTCQGDTLAHTMLAEASSDSGSSKVWKRKPTTIETPRHVPRPTYNPFFANPARQTTFGTYTTSRRDLPAPSSPTLVPAWTWTSTQRPSQSQSHGHRAPSPQGSSASGSVATRSPSPPPPPRSERKKRLRKPKPVPSAATSASTFDNASASAPSLQPSSGLGLGSGSGSTTTCSPYRDFDWERRQRRFLSNAASPFAAAAWAFRPPKDPTPIDEQIEAVIRTFQEE